MPKIMFIGMLFLICCLLTPYHVKAAAGISNGVRNFVVDQAGSRSTDYTFSKDNQTEHEAATVEGISSGVGAAATIGTATAGAAMAGAGSLAGYAGMASAVSSLGLGGVTTVGATLLGHAGLTGAAATAACTAAVGGPLVMGGIIVGGIGAAGYGIYRGGAYLLNTDAGKWATEKTDKAWNLLKSLW